MKTKLIIASLLAVLLSSASAEEKARAKVQLAILLDTSGSMSGLIEQTKTQLWTVVNTFIAAKQNGEAPFVEVALYEYGAGNHEEFRLRQIQPLTRDLDQISLDLFSLETRGSEEYCGAVIDHATRTLKWDPSPTVYKAIFIAGNEPFTQGPIQPQVACSAAIGKGIIVNTIHCGTEQAGLSGGWKDGALLADGSFLIIDHNAAVVHIEAPQDVEIMKLNDDLNKTYLTYGKQGGDKFANQAIQDGNAFQEKKAGAAVQRAVTKASWNYHNSSWDLVDATAEKDFDWTKVDEADLPEKMKKLDLEGRKKFVEQNRVKRKEIQTKIQNLNKARLAFVAEKKKESAEKDGKTLDSAIKKTVQEQATKKGYEFTK